MYLFVDVKNLKKIVFNDYMTYDLHERDGEKHWIRKDPEGIRKPRKLTWDEMIDILQRISFDTDDNNLIMFKTGILHIVTTAKTWRKGEKKAEKIKHAAKRAASLKVEAEKKAKNLIKKSVGDKSKKSNKSTVVVADAVKNKPVRIANKK